MSLVSPIHHNCLSLLFAQMPPTYKSIEILASDSDFDDNDDNPGTAVVPEQLDKQAQPPSPPTTVTKTQKLKREEKGMSHKPGVSLSA